MKKSIVGLAVMAALALSCNKTQPTLPAEPGQTSANSTVHVAVDVAWEQTRALSADEKGITPSFSEGDVIYVFDKRSDPVYMGTLTNSGGNLSRFSGDLTVSYLATGDYKIGLYYNQRDAEGLKTNGVPDANKMTLDADGYSGQKKGTLEEIAKDFDIAVGETNLHCDVETFGEDALFTPREVTFNGPVTLKADQAIVKFVFKRADTGEALTNIQKLEFFYGVYYNTSKYEATQLIKTTLTDGTPRGEYYVAIQGTPNDDHRYLLTFIATTASDTGHERQFWSYKLLPHDFEPGKSYISQVPMEVYDEVVPVDLGLSVNWYNINKTANASFVATYDAIDWTECKNFQLWEEDPANRVGWPTMEQYQELMDPNNTSFGWISIYGYKGYRVNGYAVKSRKPGYTDRFIFFPASGLVYNHGNVDESYQVPYGNQGHYWTGSYIKPSESMSWSEIEFYFDSPKGGAEAGYTGTIELTHGSVNYGFSLRKVAEKPATPSSGLPSGEGFWTGHEGYGDAQEDHWN